jgi:hypothetical protein
MLILASDGGPNNLYTHLQHRSWRMYMNSHPDIEAYFYKANPNLTEDYYFDGDVLWVKCIEQYPKLWNKFILALGAFKNRLHEFDYVCRPDLSTFLVLDRYIEFLNMQPKIKMCCATALFDSVRSPFNFPSGACFTISSDLATYILQNQVNPSTYGIDTENDEIDDVRMGIYLHELKIEIIPDNRAFIHIRWQEQHLRDFIYNKERFCVRIVHYQEPRLLLDMAIHNLLLSIFYPTV